MALTVYFDTSALMKLVLREPGSDETHGLWLDASRRAASVLAYVESRAALGAALRDRRVPALAGPDLARRLDLLWEKVHGIDVDRALARDAGDLAADQALRGADAVHLATAIALQDPRLVLATWDRDLAEAALATGIDVFPAA